FADAPDLPGQARLVFFPFNCFGNLADRDEVVAAIASHASHALVSSFQTSKAATEQRARYYTHCGFTNVTGQEDNKGILATAEEGLHSYAYHQEILESLFAEYGFQLCQESEFGGIGISFHWTSTAQSRTTAMTTVPAFMEPRWELVTPGSAIEVTVL